MSSYDQSASKKSTFKVIKFETTKENDRMKFDLIDFIKHHRFVWDSKDEAYNRTDKNKVFADFAQTFYPNNPIVTEGSVKATWNSLRSGFSREQARLAQPKPAGDDAPEVRWKFYQPLAFLKENHDPTTRDEKQKRGANEDSIFNDEFLDLSDYYQETDYIPIFQINELETNEPNVTQSMRALTTGSGVGCGKKREPPNVPLSGSTKRTKAAQCEPPTDKSLADYMLKLSESIRSHDEKEGKYASLMIELIKTNKDLQHKVDILLEEKRIADSQKTGTNYNFVLSILDLLNSIQDVSKLTVLKAKLFSLVAEVVASENDQENDTLPLITPSISLE